MLSGRERTKQKLREHAISNVHAKQPASAVARSYDARTVLVRSSEGEDLYIGFPKNDYDRSAGRKGRVIKDDPSKYPSRNEIVGGWAGGEAGLWQFRDQIKRRRTRNLTTNQSAKSRMADHEKSVWARFAQLRTRAFVRAAQLDTAAGEGAGLHKSAGQQRRTKRPAKLPGEPKCTEDGKQLSPRTRPRHRSRGSHGQEPPDRGGGKGGTIRRALFWFNEHRPAEESNKSAGGREEIISENIAGSGGNTGVKGRVVYDDDDKYPNKEDVGPLSGATGGFAGGELGVKSFAATGEVKLRQPGQPGGQGVSPLSIIFLLLGAGGTGAALYFNGFFSGTAESGFTAESVMKAATSAAQSATTAATSVATGEQTDKTPILIGAGVIGGLAALTAAKIAFDSVKDQLREGASKALVLGAFATVVLLTAKAVIED
eukprot:gene24412-10013_t